MDDEETRRHADALRRAIAEAEVERGHGVVRQEIMAATGKSYRAVGYWTSPTSPKMPSAADRAHLRKILGPYDAAGDPVEVAIRRSELAAWRQTDVIGTYQRHLHEQRREVAG